MQRHSLSHFAGCTRLLMLCLCLLFGANEANAAHPVLHKETRKLFALESGSIAVTFPDQTGTQLSWEVLTADGALNRGQTEISASRPARIEIPDLLKEPVVKLTLQDGGKTKGSWTIDRHSIWWEQQDYELYLLPGKGPARAPTPDGHPVIKADREACAQRPDLRRIRETFVRSGNAGQHPRILVTRRRIEELKAQASGDAQLARLIADCLADADKSLLKENRFWITGTGTFSTLQSDLGMLRSLGLGWLLTGDRKYVDHAWKQVKQAIDRPEWGATQEHQFLGTGNMSAIMGLAYDWFYDGFSPEQRRQLREAIAEKALKPGLFFHSIRYPRWVTNDNNWNPVSNGGLLTSAIAIADEEPDLAFRMMENSLASLEFSLASYGPDGGWEEGPGYWGYGTMGLLNALAPLESAMGTCFGLDEVPGIRQTGYFPFFMNGPGGNFNFGDGSWEKTGGVVDDPEVLWFARHFRDQNLASLCADPKLFRAKGNKLLLWYPSAVEKRPAATPLDCLYRGKDNRVGTGSFRSAWEDPRAWYLGFHAGSNLANHGQADAGSFVLDCEGVRFAVDVGDGRHDHARSQDYFSKDKQRNYRWRAEGNNVVVLSPGTHVGQNMKGNPKHQAYESSAERAFSVVDLTSCYQDAPKNTGDQKQAAQQDGQAANCARYLRGFRLDRRNDLAVIQDEIELRKPEAVYWFMHTQADLKIAADGRSATLTQDGRTLHAMLSGTPEAKFIAMEARSMLADTASAKTIEIAKFPQPQLRKLAVKTDGVTRISFAVTFSRVGLRTPPDFNPLQSWK